MKNIMKMSLYEFRKNSLLRTILVATLLGLVVVLFCHHLFEPEETIFETLNSSGSFTVLGIFVGIFTACGVALTVCGSDIKDKTIHYDLMFGHSRKQVYFGRAIIALMLGGIISLVMMVTPFVAALLFMEPGEGVAWGGIFVRVLLMELIFLRMSCECILILNLLENMELSALLYLAVVFGVTYLGEMCRGVNTYLFGVLNVSEAIHWGAKSNYRIDGTSVTIYQYMPDADVIWKTVIYSVVIGVVCLALGYAAFARDDMK